MGLADTLGRAAMGPFTKALPPMGDTERAALEAGTVGFEGELFAGRPDFDALRAREPAPLSEAEQRFLDEDVRDLCAMLDDHAIDEAGDLPPEVWQFLRERRFFGMIIPQEHGGLGFGHAAHASGRDAHRHRQRRRGGDGDGAQLARPGRAAAALRHRGTAPALPAAPGRRPRAALLRPDLALRRLRRRGDPRHRRADRARGRRQDGARLRGHLRQALHHAGAGGHGGRAGLPGRRPGAPGRRARARHHLRADPGADRRAWTSAAATGR